LDIVRRWISLARLCIFCLFGLVRPLAIPNSVIITKYLNDDVFFLALSFGSSVCPVVAIRQINGAREHVPEGVMPSSIWVTSIGLNDYERE